MPRKTKETGTKETEKEKKVTASKSKKETKKNVKPKAQAKSVKKTDSKKEAKKETKKVSKTKKASSTKKVAKKAVEKKPKKRTVTSKKNISKKTYSPEYYDLPFSYNKTVVTILAQTPTNIFVYWEISNKDRENLKNHFGEYFFEITKPVLIVHNITKNYSFEIDINDFANSWYIEVDDSDSEYQIELGRRPIDINYSYMPSYDKEKNGPISPVLDPYIFISSSNDLVVPNNHVLFNWSNKIYFKNVKTNAVIEKDLKGFSFINGYGKIIDVYELYKNEFGDNFLQNPSSRKS